MIIQKVLTTFLRFNVKMKWTFFICSNRSKRIEKFCVIGLKQIMTLIRPSLHHTKSKISVWYSDQIWISNPLSTEQISTIWIANMFEFQTRTVLVKQWFGTLSYKLVSFTYRCISMLEIKCGSLCGLLKVIYRFVEKHLLYESLNYDLKLHL